MNCRFLAAFCGSMLPKVSGSTPDGAIKQNISSSRIKFFFFFKTTFLFRIQPQKTQVFRRVLYQHKSSQDWKLAANVLVSKFHSDETQWTRDGTSLVLSGPSRARVSPGRAHASEIMAHSLLQAQL